MKIVRSGLRLLSPFGSRARLSVLIFHRVLPQPDPLFPDEMYAERFDRICGWLKTWFNVMPLDVAAHHLRYGSLPERACCITFDDGYADNLEIATPILQRHGLTSTFFIATGFLDGGRMWNDTLIETIRHCRAESLALEGLGQFALGSITERRQALHTLIGKIKYLPLEQRRNVTEQIASAACVEPAKNLMLGADGVRALRMAGMQIGAHTVTHPILARLTTDEAREEMRESQRFLQDLLQERVGLFAYPNGKPGTDYLPEHVVLARELGFDAAVSTAWGAADSRTDSFQIPRFTPWDQSRAAFGMRMIRNLI